MRTDYEWVKRCIESCTNTWQLQTAWELLLLFENKYNKCNDLDMLEYIYADKQSSLII